MRKPRPLSTSELDTSDNYNQSLDGSTCSLPNISDDDEPTEIGALKK